MDSIDKTVYFGVPVLACAGIAGPRYRAVGVAAGVAIGLAGLQAWRTGKARGTLTRAGGYAVMAATPGGLAAYLVREARGLPASIDDMPVLTV